MRAKSVSAFFVICAASVVLSGCDQVAATQGTGGTAAASSGLKGVIANARSFGATGTQYGDQAAVVVYAGPANAFIKCTSRRSGADLTKFMTLDARTKVAVSDQTVSAQTLYVATTIVTAKDGSKAAQSSAFSTAKAGQFDFGATCRATGRLEQRLLTGQ